MQKINIDDATQLFYKEVRGEKKLLYFIKYKTLMLSESD